MLLLLQGKLLLPLHANLLNLCHGLLQRLHFLRHRRQSQL